LTARPDAQASSAETSTSSSTAPDKVALRRTPPRRSLASALVFLLLGVLPAVGLPFAWMLATKDVDGGVALVALVACVACGLAWLVWLFALPRPRPIVVDDVLLQFPFARGRMSVRLDELVILRVERRALFVIAAVSPGQRPRGDVGAWLLPRRSFVDDDGAHRVVELVRARLLRDPRGPSLLARLDENVERQRRFLAQRPIVTWAVSAACVGAFVGELATDALGQTSVLLLWGANSGARVLQGEVWRVVTACLLHGSVLHLVMNLTSLLPTGAVVERWMGRTGFAVVLFASGVGGHVASALAARAPLSVGASGAIFGLLGVLFVSSIRFRRHATGGLRVPLSTWLFLLLANALLSTLPFIDVVAHGAGFVCGVVAGGLCSPRPSREPVLSLAARRVAAGAALALTLAALIAAVVTAWHTTGVG
jgi:rhomboid protease GluP